jgi:hypothetical protein
VRRPRTIGPGSRRVLEPGSKRCRGGSGSAAPAPSSGA